MTKTEIENVLWTAAGNSQGETVQADAGVLRQMRDLGLIGSNNGLTRKGSIARERMVNAAQAAAFGF